MKFYLVIKNRYANNLTMTVNTQLSFSFNYGLTTGVYCVNFAYFLSSSFTNQVLIIASIN